MNAFLSVLARATPFKEIDWKLAGVLYRAGYWRKLFNYLLVQAQFGFQFTRLLGKPYVMAFDPATLCNLRCPMCNVGTRAYPKPMEPLAWEHFTTVMDQLGPTLIQVDMFKHGEPLLHRQVYDMIRYCKKFGIRVSISSNLQVVDAAKLVASGLDALTVAVDGASQETYEKYRIGGRIDRAFTNVRKIVEERKKQGKSIPRVTWKFIVFRHNEHEIEKARHMAAELGFDGVEFSGGIVGTPPLTPEQEAWVPLNPEYSLYNRHGTSIQKHINRTERRRCSWPWVGLTLDSRINVQTCCRSMEAREDHGDLKRTSFRSIWNNHRYRTSRIHLREGRPLVPESDNPCEKCTVAGSHNPDIRADSLAVSLGVSL